jgi:hypothetical protein
MREAGQRIQLHVAGRKVSGYWDGATVRTWLHGAWQAMPAETLELARDALRRVHGQQGTTGHADRHEVPIAPTTGMIGDIATGSVGWGETPGTGQQGTGQQGTGQQGTPTAAEIRFATCEKDLHMHGSCRCERPDASDR